MAAAALRFRDGDRVTVNDDRDPFTGQTGEVVDWYFGMSGVPMLFVRLDGTDRPYRFTQSQLQEETDHVAA